ncbi:cation transporter, partial [Actinomycetospora soli]|uniref:cation transporter n=1 Tax=Actinomycetospora soli TaxID=2893887 RepID=UPI001E5754F1
MSTDTQTSPASTDGEQHVELALGGMTCASCANRIERKLNKLDGVQASVNFATEKARVTYPETVSTADIVAAVEAAGYSAAPPAERDADSAADSTADDPEAGGEAAQLRTRLVVSLVLSVPTIALAMVPALQFTYWQWASLTLAAPVIIW